MLMAHTFPDQISFSAIEQSGRGWAIKRYDIFFDMISVIPVP